MKTAGIICEFNPFHKGHQYLIDSVRRELSPGAVVCIMSGNFVQRGEPALWDKWSRARAALEGGADLVIQMPVSVTLGAAPSFAAGAVDVAAGIGCDYLCFGAENPELSMLEKAAMLESEPDTAQKSGALLKQFLGEGLGYAAAYARMVSVLMPEADKELFSRGNNILGMEYIRRIKEKQYAMQPHCFAIKESLGHAESIRSLQNKEYANSLYSLLRYKLLTSSPEDLRRIPEVSEGLENRILAAVRKSAGLEDLVSAVSTKRYPKARVQRCLLKLLLGIVETGPAEPYAHVLAFNAAGQQLLRTSTMRLYSGVRPEDSKNNPSLACDVLADDIYSVIFGKDLYPNSDYVCKPYQSKI